MLSTRQRQVADRLVQGKSIKQIAAELGISRSTCADHIHLVYQKLNVSTRGECTAKLARIEMKH